jgi:hypothetical protein
MCQLLVLTGGGRTYRYATERLVHDGDTYLPGLRQIPLVSELSEMGGMDKPEGVAVSLVAPDMLTSVDAIKSLPGMSAVVSILADRGDGVLQNTVYLSGSISAPSYGAKTEPILFSVQPSVIQQSVTFPPTEATVDTSTFSDFSGVGVSDRCFDAAILGRAYPFVFGTPGVVDEGTTIFESGFGSIDLSLGIGGTPGLMIAASTYVTGGLVHYLMIAGHSVEATSVRVMNATKLNGWKSYTVFQAEDKLGRTYSYVKLTDGDGAGEYNISAATSTQGHEYVVNWNAGGGALAEGGVVETPAQLWEWITSISRYQTDSARTQINLSVFSGMRLGGYIDEPVSPFDWLQAHLTEILPISFVDEGAGIYPKVWPYAATADEAEVHYDADAPGVDRVSTVSWADTKNIANEFNLKFGFGLNGDSYKKVLIATGDAAKEDNPSTVLTAGLRQSDGLHGTLSRTIECDILYDGPTAAQILLWLEAAYSRMYREVSILVSSKARIPTVGGVVLFSDSSIYFDSEACMVTKVTKTGGNTTAISLRTLN